jgi:hypothetical protein
MRRKDTKDVYVGENHGVAYEKATAEHPIADTLIDMDYFDNYDDGFVTDQGNFIIRDEGRPYLEGEGAKGDYLTSEELTEDQRLTYQNRGKGEGVGLNELRAAFPGARIDIAEAPRGKFTVQLPNGIELEVDNVNVITPNELSVQGRWRQMAAEGALPTGEYQDGVIRIRKGIGDQWTLHHESLHFLRDMDMITPKEWAALKGRVKREIRAGNLEVNDRANPGSEEDIADWVADQMYKGEVKPTTLVGKALAAIRNFVNSLMDKVRPSAEGVIRGIQSGQIFERPVDPRRVMGKQKFQTANKRWFSQMIKTLEEKKGLLPKSTSAFKMNTAIYQATVAKKGKQPVLKSKEVAWSGIYEYISNKVNSQMRKYLLDKEGVVDQETGEVTVPGDIGIKDIDDVGDLVYFIRHEVPPEAEAYSDFGEGTGPIDLSDPWTDITMMGSEDPTAYWGMPPAKVARFKAFMKDAPDERNVKITRQELMDFLNSNQKMEISEVLRGPIPDWYIKGVKDESLQTFEEETPVPIGGAGLSEADTFRLRFYRELPESQRDEIRTAIATLTQAEEHETWVGAKEDLETYGIRVFAPEYNATITLTLPDIPIAHRDVDAYEYYDLISAHDAGILNEGQAEAAHRPDLVFDMHELPSQHNIRQAINDLVLIRAETAQRVGLTEVNEDIHGQIEEGDMYQEARNFLESEGFTLHHINGPTMYMIQEPVMEMNGVQVGGVSYALGDYQEHINTPTAEEVLGPETPEETGWDPDLWTGDMPSEELAMEQLQAMADAGINTMRANAISNRLGEHDIGDPIAWPLREVLYKYDIDLDSLIDSMDNLTQAEFGDIMGQVTSEEDFMSAVLMIYANGRGETVVDVGLRQLPAAAPAGDPYSTRVRNAINVLSGLETLGNRGLEQGTLRQENLEEVFQNTIESPEFTNPARILGNAGFTIEPEITEGNGPNADEGRISFTVTDPNQEGAMSMSVLAERITPLAQDEFAIEQETIANLDQLFPRQDDGSNTDAQLNYLVDLDLNMDVMHTLVGEWSGGGLGIEDDEAVVTREVFARYDIDPQETLDAFNNLTEEEQVEFFEAGDGREAFMEQVLMLTVPLEEAGLGDAPLRIPRLGTAPAAPAAQKELPVKWKEHAGVAFHIRFHDTALPDGSKVLFLDEIQSDLAKAAKGDSDHLSAFKDWPFVKNYTESALRRMVRWAAESGQYDSIGWTTGAQQVERYETATRRRVDSLNWRWDPEETY